MFPYVVNFGLQYYLREFLTGPVFNMEDIREADDVCEQHFQDPGRKIFNRDGWERLYDCYGGVLPMEFYGLDEGLKVRPNIPLYTMENTDDRFGWLTNPLETLTLKIWYTTTVCTNSHFTLKDIGKFMKGSCDPEYYEKFRKFMLQDFGARGVSSEESARLGGMAHLVNGWGTDTINALLALRDYYYADLKKKIPGFSVPAYEHSTVTSWRKLDGTQNEVASYENGFETFPNGILSIVVDSYDQRNAIENIFGGSLKWRVDERGSRDGLFVARLDSGIPNVEVPWAIEKLMEKFGERNNSMGFREITGAIKILQGDGMNRESVHDLCQTLIDKRISLSNIATLGEGGALLQKVDRDTCGFALKGSNIDIDGEDTPFEKKPKTDPTKGSLSGRLAVKRVNCELVALSKQKRGPKDADDKLKLRSRNGMNHNETDIYKIRDLVEQDDMVMAA